MTNTRYRGKISCVDLPPCHSAFIEHCRWANYPSRIWNLALLPKPLIPSPIGNGWRYEVGDDGEQLAIKWMSCKPAPDEVKNS